MVKIFVKIKYVWEKYYEKSFEIIYKHEKKKKYAHIIKKLLYQHANVLNVLTVSEAYENRKEEVINTSYYIKFKYYEIIQLIVKCKHTIKYSIDIDG